MLVSRRLIMLRFILTACNTIRRRSMRIQLVHYWRFGRVPPVGVVPGRRDFGSGLCEAEEMGEDHWSRLVLLLRAVLKNLFAWTHCVCA